MDRMTATIFAISSLVAISQILFTVRYEKDDNMRSILEAFHILLFALIILFIRWIHSA